MDSRISWGQLLNFIGVFLFFYYAVILLVFYRRELSTIIKTRVRKKVNHAPHLSPQVSGNGGSTGARDEVVYSQVLELMQDCKPVFHAAVEQSLEKEQILDALQVRLRKYPQVKNTAFQVAVSNHIDQELQNRRGLSLSDSELESLWG